MVRTIAIGVITAGVMVWDRLVGNKMLDFLGVDGQYVGKTYVQECTVSLIVNEQNFERFAEAFEISMLISEKNAWECY